IQVVLVVFWIAQWRGFGIGCAICALADVGGAQNRQPLRIRRHNSVLHSVVYHLDEVAGAVWSAVQVALLSRTFGLVPTYRSRNVAHPGSERGENWIEPLDDLVLSANHHAVPSLQTPDTSTGAHIHIVDFLGSELLCSPDIVDVVGVAPVDEDVPRREMRRKTS